MGVYVQEFDVYVLVCSTLMYSNDTLVSSLSSILHRFHAGAWNV